MPIDKCKKNDANGRLSFGKHQSGSLFRQESSMPPKTGGVKVLWGTEYWYSLRVCLYQIHIGYKRENGDFIMENLSVHQSKGSRLISQWGDGSPSCKDH